MLKALLLAYNSIVITR